MVSPHAAKIVTAVTSEAEWERVIRGEIKARVFPQDQEVRPGMLIEVFKDPEHGLYPSFIAEVYAVWRVLLKDVGDSMIKDLGLKDFSALCDHVRSLYPQATIDTAVTIIRWNEGRALNGGQEAVLYYDALAAQHTGCTECEQRDQT